MSENPDVSFLLGYGSYATMSLRSIVVGENSNVETPAESHIVPLLNGDYNRSMTIPTQGTFSIPFNNTSKSKIRTGTGVYSYNGSISFEMTNSLRNFIFSNDYDFFKRNSFLDIELYDGEGLITIKGAVWNSLNVRGSVGGLIDASISFLSCNGYKEDICVNYNSAIVEEENDTNINLEPYWSYGGEGIQEFQLSLTRNVTPIYLNEQDWIGPSYLRVGLMDASLSVTCWEKWFDHNSIVLGGKTLSFLGSFQNSRSYQFAGIGGEGLKTYTNNAVGLSGDGDLFVINDNQASESGID